MIEIHTSTWFDERSEQLDVSDREQRQGVSVRTTSSLGVDLTDEQLNELICALRRIQARNRKAAADG